MRSAYSRRSLPDILSSPVALDLFSLFKSEETLVVLVGRSSNLLSVPVSYLRWLSVSEEAILLASFDPMVAKWLLNLSDSSLGFVTDNPFTFKEVTVVFPDFLEVSSLIVCQVLLESPLFSLKVF